MIKKATNAKKIAIEGHASSEGDKNLNLKLSDARAKAVMKYLVDHGIEKERLTAKGFGSSKPIADNDDGRGSREESPRRVQHRRARRDLEEGRNRSQDRQREGPGREDLGREEGRGARSDRRGQEEGARRRRQRRRQGPLRSQGARLPEGARCSQGTGQVTRTPALRFGETLMTKSFGMFMLLALAAGCSFHARSPNEYRDATQALLDTKSAEIKTCYDDALKGKADLAGTVTVHFTVEAETGALGNVSADAAKTQAPEVLTQCVVKSLGRPEARSARTPTRATARSSISSWSVRRRQLRLPQPRAEVSLSR